jgi:hypothetical protein
MKRSVYIFVLLIAAIQAFGQDTTYERKYKLGNTLINMFSICYVPCSKAVIFINLHEDEKTSITAGDTYLKETAGTILSLKHTGERLITFYLGDKKFMFDPNRIFSKFGIRTSLTKLSAYTPMAEKVVDSFARHILTNYVEGSKLIVTLHNNTDKNFSVSSYKKGQPEGRNAAQVFINKDMDEDDFILTTEPAIFNKLKEKNINVVLQNTKTVIDDGSLSVYAAKKKIAYVNVEAQDTHLEEQIKLLEALTEVIDSYDEAR